LLARFCGVSDGVDKSERCLPRRNAGGRSGHAFVKKVFPRIKNKKQKQKQPNKK
jgi:hypothetical protein